MAYAARTQVAPQKTRAEIEAYLSRQGASRIGILTDHKFACVFFDMKERRLRFQLIIKERRSATLTDQHMRASWRALLLCIKAKMTSVESGIETFDEAFLAHVVVPDSDKTIYEHMRETLPQIVRGEAPLRLTGSAS